MSKPKTPDAIDISVGLRVHAARVATGMSHAKLAEGLGLTFQQIQKYEKGSNRISSSRLQQIAILTGRDIGWFFDRQVANSAHPEPTRDLGKELLASPYGRELAEKYLSLLHDADRRAVVSLCAALGERDPLPRMIATEQA